MGTEKQETSFGEKTLGLVSVGMLILMVFLVILQVIARSIPGWTLQGIEELARLIFVWGCFASFALTFLQDYHLRVSALIDRVPQSVQRWTVLMTHLITLIIGLVMVVAGSQLVLGRWMYPDYSIALLYPRSLFWVPAPLCGMVIVIHSMTRSLEALRYMGDG